MQLIGLAFDDAALRPRMGMGAAEKNRFSGNAENGGTFFTDSAGVPSL